MTDPTPPRMREEWIAAGGATAELLAALEAWAAEQYGGPPWPFGDTLGTLLDGLAARGCSVAFAGRPGRTWYRSLAPDGTLQCESSNPRDFAPGQSCHGQPNLTFERLQQWTATDGWQPWTPPAG